jgi:NSS family neurotransmitter:Na+ symporter
MGETLRERWLNRPSFVMAAIGSAVGLGNIWRFPFIAYANGGGAFLIPYFVALFTAGIPLMMLECGLGIRMQGAPPRALAGTKSKAEWVGWWATLTAFVIITYYAVVMSWCFNYLFHSFTLEWSGGAKEFFFKDVLKLSTGPGQLSGLVWPILFGLLLTWVAVFLIIFKGLGRVGRVVIVTVPLPIILIIILAIRGITLPGAAEGVNFYLAPDFSKLLNGKVWLEAYGQIFFSLSLAMGIMITYSSYLPKKTDITNNAFMISLANCGTSFLAGFAIFSTLGYLAHVTQTDVSKVAAAGPGLAFVTIPIAISKLPFAANLFGAIFFLTLLSLGIDSLFSLVEANVGASMDKWGITRKKATFFICLLAFLIGFLFTSGGGLYWLDIVDHWINNYGLVPVGLAEVIIIGYIFGARRFREMINESSEVKVGIWWEFMIKVVTPAILIISLVTNFYQETQKSYEGYPLWATVCGGWLVVIGIVIISVLLMRSGKSMAEPVK